MAVSSPVRILLVEDSEIDAELITRQLGKLDLAMHVERAVIRRDYERLFEALRFDLILSDYSLPGFTGVEALTFARSRDPNIPFIFISGVLGEEFATEALRAGATDYVTKKNLTRIPMVVTRALVEASDRSERRRAVEALAESEQRFRAMADTAPALIWEVATDGKVTFANDRFQSEFGFDPQRMVDEGWKSFVHPDDWDTFKRVRKETLVARTVFANNIRVIDGAGDTRWLRSESRPRFGDDGTFLGYIGCAVDITASKLARDALEMEIESRTEELRVKEEALRQAQKMEAIGQLTGGIAHDFNNMLAGIIGSADMLRKRLREQRFAECDRYVDLVVSAANRAAALTQRLLAFSRQQTLDVKATDIERRVMSLADLLRRTLGPSIELIIDFPDGLWAASTDPNQFESAILNLAINARDAMPNGGRLLIEAANVRADDATREYVKIDIVDTGSGMDEATLSKAIDPFFTTKPIGQGTGLGLSMVYGFMTQTGGNLNIESRVGTGTRVSLLLPRAAPTAQPDVEAEKTETHTVFAGGRVYVVEDEPIVRMLVVDHLTHLGYDVVQAADAEAALADMRDGQRADLLLTDVGLPGMSGRELATEVRKLHPDISILFATGYADGAGFRSDFVGGNMDLILKPFSVDDLANRIGTLLAKAR